MNIGIIGYGRMGRTIEGICKKRGHAIGAVIDLENHDDIHRMRDKNIDVAIEFTQPQSAYDNIAALLRQWIPVVSGTTGCIDQMAQFQEQVIADETGIFYASNNSTSVYLSCSIKVYAAE